MPNFDKVPAPFTPVTRNTNTLSAWHRDYEFENGILPRQITTQGWKLLREPIRLIVTLGDGTVIRSDTIKSKITWNDRPKISVTRQVNGKLAEVKKAISKDLRREGRAVGILNWEARRPRWAGKGSGSPGMPAP